MKKIYMWSFIIIGILFSHSALYANDSLVCTQQYEPVCSVDGTTYGNACMAGSTEIKYSGVCLGRVDEYVVKSAYTKLLNTYFGEYNAIEKAVLYQDIIERIQKIAYTPEKKSLFEYISYLTKIKLHTEIFEPYLQENVVEIVPQEAKFGGKWYITEFDWNGVHDVTIYFEDGHFAESQDLNISADMNGLQVELD